MMVYTPKEVEMNSLNYDAYESIANEHNARILKASNDARLLRSLSKNSEIGHKERSIRSSSPRLVSALASLFLKRQIA
jgi:hypothetical protein